MDIKRKPFQGIANIIRFNWHFYVIALATLVSAILISQYLPPYLKIISTYIIRFTTISILASLFISFYIYDLSSLYQLNWIPKGSYKKGLTINAGFDETSKIIKTKFPKIDLTICDFYNPKKHTEISIKRARNAYPPTENTIEVSTNQLPFPDNSFDCVFAIFSAHEIRDENERVIFFKELHRILKSDGQLFVTEHLRDLNNFVAYTIGFFHFYSKKSWLVLFEKSKFKVHNKLKTTPFITTFILEKNGNTL